ncbi:unnamed protein product, partial [Hapterophycus canaliculatus]
DLSEVERALATCVPPAPPGAAPQPSPPVTPVLNGRLDGDVDGGGDSRGTAETGVETGAAAAATVVGSGKEPPSSTGRGGVEVGGGGSGGSGGSGGGDAVQDGRPAAVDPHPSPAPPPPPPPPPPANPYVATEAQGGSADYMDFVRVRGLVSRKAAACFKPRTFLRFPRDIRGRIPSRTFFKHVYESVTLQKTRLTLHFYDSEALGFLREQDLENYVYDHIPTMPALRAIHDNFYPFYVFTAVRRFMFFLDPKRTGKIPIDALVRSSIMEEFLQVRMAAGSAPGTDSSSRNLAANGAGNGGKGDGEGRVDSPTSGGALEEGGQRGSSSEGGGGGGGAAAGETALQDLSKNWFSAENTLRVYGE